MENKKTVKHSVTVVAMAIIVIALAAAFWPRPKVVDMMQVAYRPLSESISEQGRTRVRNSYQVSAPVAGTLARVSLEAGDKVSKGQTLAIIYPSPAPLLDRRALDEAKALLDSARAAHALTRARLAQARADRTLANDELQRVARLFEDKSASLSQKQRAERTLKSSDEEVRAQQAALVMREAEITAAKTRLDRFDSVKESKPVGVTAPVSGYVVKITQKSEQAVQAGSPLLEVADIENELEVLIELLTVDAVKVSPGNRVDIDDWGGDTLHGIVDRIEPGGFIKYSALGVEEQRVNTFVRFGGDFSQRKRLGDGFRVDCTIYTWQKDKVLTVPVSALFRYNDNWAVYRAVDGKLALSELSLGHKNATYAEVLSGLGENDKVVLYPDPSLEPGEQVRARD